MESVSLNRLGRGTASRNWLGESVIVPGSITRWLFQLKSGDRDAAQPIWEKYFSMLVRLARAHLNGSPRRVADEEDVVMCAFDSFCRGAEQGRFPKLDDRSDLWRLLMTITERKASNQVRYTSAKKRRGIRSAVSYSDNKHSLEIHPTPWFSAQVAEIYLELLSELRDDGLRSIAVSKMEGYTNKEIASKLETSVRTVVRKLALIRVTWARLNKM